MKKREKKRRGKRGGKAEKRMIVLVQNLSEIWGFEVWKKRRKSNYEPLKLSTGLK